MLTGTRYRSKLICNSITPPVLPYRVWRGLLNSMSKSTYRRSRADLQRVIDRLNESEVILQDIWKEYREPYPEWADGLVDVFGLLDAARDLTRQQRHELTTI